MRCKNFAVVLSSQQRRANDFANLDDDLPLNPAAEDGTPVVNDDRLGDADDARQRLAVTEDNLDDGGGVTNEPGSSRGRSATSSDGQPL